MWPYEGGDAASADGGLEVALQLLLDGAGRVEALPQQQDGVDEEEGGDAVDDVLTDLDPGHRRTEVRLKTKSSPPRTTSTPEPQCPKNQSEPEL